MTYVETQESVTAWAAETFGTPKSQLTILLRANEEMAELLQDVERDDREAVRLELADVIIVLYRWAERERIDLFSYNRRASERWARGPALELIAHMNRMLAATIESEVLGKHPTWYIPEFMWSAEEIARIYGVDILDAIDEKMAVNRSRKWVRRGDGCGEHVK